MNVMVDSFAWMEFFKGTERGKKVLNILHDEDNRIYTTVANYYELYYRLTQEQGPSKRDEALAFIKDRSRLMDITEEVARGAAEIRLIEGLSAIDAFTLAAARLVGGKVLTGDRDFDKFKDEIIKI